MKRRKKLYVVGKNTSIAMVIIVSLFTVYVIVQVINSISGLIKTHFFSGVLMIVLMIAVAIFEIPMLATFKKHWDITEEYLEYYDITNYIEQWKYLISILTDKEEFCTFRIRLNDIRGIKIYWKKLFNGYGNPIYPIYFDIISKDNKVTTFKPLVTSNNKEVIDAVNYLKDKYFIEIDDEYNILTVLKDSSQDLNEYISRIEA